MRKIEPFTAFACLAVVLLLADGCSKERSGAQRGFEARIDTGLHPAQPEVRDRNGNPQPVAASRDENGVQSDFLEGIILLRPKNDADLQNFLQRYGGTVVADDTIPPAPPQLGVTLTDEQRKPTQFTIRIDLAKANARAISANAAAIGLRGTIEFSSEAGLQTLAGLFDAKAAGFRATADYIAYGNQTFPVTLFRTEERQLTAGPPPTFADPFANTAAVAGAGAAFADFGGTGGASNVLLAWQFIAAHGIHRRVRVAIIDSGFYLDGAGLARGTDSDLPPPPQRVAQYDFTADDANAGDPGPMGCGSGNPCWWHGTGSAGVASGIANNRLGAIGTGGQIADPILLRVNGTKGQRNDAIRTAVAWGADVASMSFGGDCNTSCRIDDRDDDPFSDAVNSGSKIVFVASAGNGRGNPATGYAVGDPSYVHPCIEDHVICVGALNPGSNAKIGFSNFGPQVQIFAPTNIPTMSSPASFDAAGAPLPLAQADGPAVPQIFGGTSASAPFVAGVAAMIKAINPNLNHEEVAQILRDTALAGAAPQVTRTLDAFAAVNRAATGIFVVPDTAESNDLAPQNLGSQPLYFQANLNIDGRDRDYYQFDSPDGSVMRLDLSYPQGLGAISVLGLESVAGECGQPILQAETPLAGGGKTIRYQVPGGALKLGLRADGVNAYNMAISFTEATYAPDSYEPNDTLATAKLLRSMGGAGPFGFTEIESRITIDATLHTNTDQDYYLIRGAKLSGAERFLLVGFPAVKVYGNDSRLKLEVFNLAPGNTVGSLVAAVDGASCTPAALTVRLNEDAPYIVKVSGSAGRYTLRNGVGGDPRRFPTLVHDRIYEVLHPGEPIERQLRFPELYVFAGDPHVRGLRSAGRDVHLRLFDREGNTVGEGEGTADGETLALANISSEQVYALEVTPRQTGGREARLHLEWDVVR